MPAAAYRRPLRRAVAALLLALCVAQPGAAQPGTTPAGAAPEQTPAAGPGAVLESPVERVTVVELFTSHGCSSCPPADAWLRRFTDHPGLWSRVIPLALHVDYWDDLGWRDRFASAANSSRQRDYRRAGHISSVYTPGIVINGREWRDWFRGAPFPEAAGEPVGRLALSLANGRATLRFTPVDGTPRAGLIAHLALLGFGTASEIGAGENGGRTLVEDFVVLGRSRAVLHERDGSWRLPLPEVAPTRATRAALVAWVSAASDPTPVQAVGGWVEVQ